MTVVGTDYQFVIQGIALGSGSALSLTEVTGLDSPDVDMTVTQRSSSDGAYTTGEFTKERVITASGRINATVDTLPTILTGLKAAFQPSSSDVEFAFRLPGFGSQFCNVKPQSLRAPYTGVGPAVGFVDYIATMVAGDPRIYSSTQQSQNFGLAGGATGKVFPITFSFAFSVAASGGNTFVINGGNRVAPTVITFTGPLENPEVTNQSTGDAMKVLVTLAASETLVIDSLARTVLQGGSVSVYSRLTGYSKFINLQPGSNDVFIGADSGSGSMNLTWRDTWM